MQQQQEGLKQFSVEAYVEKRAAVESLWKKLADREAALKNLEADRGEVWTQKAKWYFKLACGAFDALNADEREEANALSEDEDIRTYDGLCFSMVWDEHEYAKALKDLEQYKEAFRSEITAAEEAGLCPPQCQRRRAGLLDWLWRTQDQGTEKQRKDKMKKQI